MEMDLPIKNVLIVEDHSEAAKVLASVVKNNFGNPRVKVSGTVAGGLKLLASEVFDMALIDIGLPDGNGIDLIRHMNIHSENTISLVTTIFDDEKHFFEALQAGACGYLLKGHSPKELGNYLKDAVEGKPPLSPGVAQAVITYFRGTNARSKPTLDIEEAELTVRESEILTFIAKGYQVKEVSKFLDITANTVSFHVKKIYKKLNIHNRAEATAAAVNMNLYNLE